VSFAPASVAGFERALAGAASVSLSAYVLARGNPVVRALESAADRGAQVHVVLDGAPVGSSRRGDGGIARTNAATAADLRRHGVDVRVTDAAAPAQHLKAAVVDGRAYLDDRNWTPTDDLVETSDARDVAGVAAAIDGRPASTEHLALTKAEAIAREAQQIARASGDTIDCASESFGASVVSVALARRAAAGAHVRLVVSDRALRHASPNERHALAKLAAAGVEIRAGASTDKLCISGGEAWLGSANPTFSPPPPMLDWGLSTTDPALVSRAAATFARDWCAARPLDVRSPASLSG
jgi:phosphatidylserine/phosphatidylglycerophosphate/cardiolipin synthase-like enzyme